MAILAPPRGISASTSGITLKCLLGTDQLARGHLHRSPARAQQPWTRRDGARPAKHESCTPRPHPHICIGAGGRMPEPRRVLIVDDELRLVDLRATYHTRHGYPVEDAADGAAAI